MSYGHPQRLKGGIEVKYTESFKMMADGLTKVLPRRCFERFRNQTGLVDISERLAHEDPENTVNRRLRKIYGIRMKNVCSRDRNWCVCGIVRAIFDAKMLGLLADGCGIVLARLRDRARGILVGAETVGLWPFFSDSIQ